MIVTIRDGRPRSNLHWRISRRLTNDCKIRCQRIHVTPHLCPGKRLRLGSVSRFEPYLMWDGHLEPRFLTRGLCEPWPDRGNVQDAQVLEQNAPAKA